jgi:hypothetical protein
VIYGLLRYIALIDSGCPVERHELKDTEWLLLGALRIERDKMAGKGNDDG